MHGIWFHFLLVTTWTKPALGTGTAHGEDTDRQSSPTVPESTHLNKDDHIIDITSREKEFKANEAICLPKIKEKQREISVQSFIGCLPSHNTRMETKLGCLQPNERKRKSPSPKLFNAGIQESDRKIRA